MADVRALLRQQRAARRIEHPHASYTDSGKLICTVCNDHVKTESLWDGHLRSTGHRQRLQALHQASSAKKTSNGHAGFDGRDSEIQGSAVPAHKRKLADSDDDLDGEDEASRRKRTRPGSPPGGTPSHEGEAPAKNDSNGKADKPITPPLHRRTSTTPSAGVEMQIPSRPATPNATGTPLATTPKAPPIGRSPLVSEEATAAQQESVAGAHETQGGAAGTAGAAGAAEPVDEDMWAAFEADLIHGSGPNANANPPAVAGGLDGDAVISAPAMSAAEVAAKSEEEERTRRRALVDIQIEDEKEEATRALETEFEVMEELEARARKLRERREALRAQTNGAAAPTAAAVNNDTKGAPARGKENAVMGDEEDDESEDDEGDEDDWDGFRFRS
ncbi:hypothetical protein VTH06DRAFT_7633 [Thermothelomyces fergusii]